MHREASLTTKFIDTYIAAGYTLSATYSNLSIDRPGRLGG